MGSIEFDIVDFEDKQVIAGKCEKYSKSEFIKKAKEMYEGGGYQLLPSTHKIMYGRVLNIKCPGIDKPYNLEEVDKRGNYPVHCVAYINKGK